MKREALTIETELRVITEASIWLVRPTTYLRLPRAEGPRKQLDAAVATAWTSHLTRQAAMATATALRTAEAMMSPSEIISGGLVPRWRWSPRYPVVPGWSVGPVGCMTRRTGWPSTFSSGKKTR